MQDFSGKVFEYSPNLVKSSVTGHGHADKATVEKAVQMMFGKIAFKSADESDALAIAVCHALNRNMKTKIKDAMKEKRI
jgi:crossover junction endodeoxyribonuclease RuvC